MRTFRQYLSEMALKGYKVDFMDSPNRGEESFLTKSDGKKDLGSQVYSSGRMQHNISGYFSGRDRAVITHPRTMRSLEQRLSRSGYDFNVLFIEDRRALTGKDYTDQVDEFMEENGVEREGRITFVKNSTSGHVMTPWMILHTLGHAVSEHCGGLSMGMEAKHGIGESVANVMGIVSGSLCRNPFAYGVGHSSWCRDAFGKVFSFKSAVRDDHYNALLSRDELLHEFVAEFLWNGDGIRVKSPYDGEDGVLKEIRSIEGGIRTLLGMCVGRIIFDYY